MPDVVQFDPINLRIVEISTGGDNSLNVQEIFSEWKDWLLADPSRLAYPQAFRYAGADPISETESLGTTFFLLNGWRIRPAEHSHRLQLVGNLFTDPAGFDIDVPTLGTFNTRVNLRLSLLVQSITTGGSGGTDWTTTERNQIRGALGITGTQAAPAGGGQLQDIRTPVVANLDATISSRSVAGDEMTLTQAEREDIAWQVLQEDLGDHAATIGSLGHEVGHVHDALIVKHGTVSAGSTASVIITSITGASSGIFTGLTIMIRGTERCARIVKTFDSTTGTFTVSIPFAFLPLPGDSVFVLSQRHSSVFGGIH